MSALIDKTSIIILANHIHEGHSSRLLFIMRHGFWPTTPVSPACNGSTSSAGPCLSPDTLVTWEEDEVDCLC
jgi:hypothetical protein